MVMLTGSKGYPNPLAGPLQAKADAAGLDAVVISFSLLSHASAFFHSEDQILKKAVEDVRKRWRLRSRILLSGYSAGAQYAHRFAFAYPHLVKACAAHAPGTWTTPDGRLLVDEIGEIKNPVEYLSSMANAKGVERRRYLFEEPDLAVAYSRRAAPEAVRIPFLVMCGTLDPRFEITRIFRDSLVEAGFAVESEWPKTPHNPFNDPRYDSEGERYTTRTVEFFNKIVSQSG